MAARRPYICHNSWKPPNAEKISLQNPFSDLAAGQELEVKRELWETRLRFGGKIEDWWCRIRELVESVKRSEQSPETPDKYDGGLYVGRAGIAYMLWYVSTKQPELAHNLESARELAFAHYRWQKNNFVFYFSASQILRPARSSRQSISSWLPPGQHWCLCRYIRLPILPIDRR